jgi:sugar phosphate isomerase/epimerase
MVKIALEPAMHHAGRLQHLHIADCFFSTLRDMNFDGLATVCVFGWEQHADDVHRRMLDRVTSASSGKK